jgi:hypothetical protein
MRGSPLAVAKPPAPPLNASDLPAGYRCTDTATVLAEVRPRTEARQRRCWRWLPPPDASAADPLAVDASIAEYERRAAALRAVTDGPVLLDGLAVRRLYPPRIGDETAALRADVTEAGTHYVLYRVDVQVGTRTGTIAAAWRWPGGSPAWLYERARTLARRLAE